MKKILSLLIAATLLFSAVACSQKPSNSDSDPSGAIGSVTDDKTSEYVEGTLHKVKVTETNRKFISGGKTDYKIVIASAEEQASKAAKFIAQHLKAASGTGVEVVLYEDSDSAVYSADAKYIYVGANSAFEDAGLTMPSDDLGICGYYVKSAGDSVFIVAPYKHGYQMGAIAFLREVAGYDMYADSCISYDRATTTLPDMDIIERPDFDYRHWQNPLTDDALYGMGYSTYDPIVAVGGNTYHNSFKWLPPTTYISEHDKWFANGGNQLCYTAHGDAAEYEAMQDEIMEQMIEYIDRNPEADAITITQEDNTDFCNCDACTEAIEKYGSINGTIIPFLNDIGERVDEYLTQKAQEEGTMKRKFAILQFAYQSTVNPPVKTDANGKVTPIDETVTCRDNVGICIAPIEFMFTKDVYDPDNAFLTDAMSAWGVVTDNIFFWWYGTDFHDFMFPYNNWYTVVDQYRYCYQLSRSYMFNEGQLGQNNGTAFTKLKDYIDSKALFDVNVNVNDVIDKWFKGYFKDAAEPMREFFDELQTHLEYLQTEYAADLPGTIYDKIGKENTEKFWKKKTIDGYLGYIDGAYAAIEKYKTSDPELYSLIHDHITIESLFPRYVVCKYYAGTLRSDELLSMRTSFKEDCLKLANDWEQEHYRFESTFTAWGV